MEAFGKRLNAYLAQTDCSAQAASAARGKMREQTGTMQLQEFALK
jgi:hypothetical protein